MVASQTLSRSSAKGIGRLGELEPLWVGIPSDGWTSIRREFGDSITMQGEQGVTVTENWRQQAHT